MDPLKNLNTWLEDMTYASEYTFLEEGKDDDELSRIAKKRGINLPSHDLAIFKCKYAFTDRVNKNGCLLPREEVAKSLSTLVGKAVDFDHFRKRICGTWIDAELRGDQIIAYGSFFKSNLQDDFTTIKDLMQRGALSVSFEAWGNKTPLTGNAYSLNDICFAGGALLLKEAPAFPGADVLEMANNRVLEFAKVMIKPVAFLHTGESTKREVWDFEVTDALVEIIGKTLGIDFTKIDKEEFKAGLEIEKEHGSKYGPQFNLTNDDPIKAGYIAYVHISQTEDYYEKLDEAIESEEDGKLETSRHWMHENADLQRLLTEVDCSVCNTKGNHDVQHMDYTTSQCMAKCGTCGTMNKISFIPKTEAIGSKMQIKEITTSANLALHEDITNFVENYEGTDEHLEAILAQEFEMEQAKFIKCMKCAAALDIHGNTGKCPKCGSSWEKDKPHFQEIRPVERTDSPYAVVNKCNPDPQLSMTLSYQERAKLSDEKFAVVVTSKHKKTGKPRKIRMFPIHDQAHVHNASARLPFAAESLKKLGISQETVKNKILKIARELKMDELMKFYKASTVEELIQAMAIEAGAKDGLGAEAIADVKAKIEQAMALKQDTKEQSDLAPSFKAFVQPHVTSLINYVKPAGNANETSLNEKSKPGTPSASDTSLNKAAVEKLEADLKEVMAKLEVATAELKKFQDAEAEKVKIELAAKIQARKDELGDFAKEMKDEDIMDETKYEMAKLRKENAELKAGKVTPAEKPDLTKGSADKNLNEGETTTRSKVDELAFGRDSKAIQENIKNQK